MPSIDRPLYACCYNTNIIAQRYGINIPNPNELLGTQEKCFRMLGSIGFEEIEIAIEQFGGYLQDAEAAWNGNANSAFGLQKVQWSQQQLEPTFRRYSIGFNFKEIQDCQNLK